MRPDSSETFPVAVDSLRPSDLARLPRMGSLARLQQPEASVLGFSSLRDGLLSTLPGLSTKRPAFVARSAGHLVGLVQFRQVLPDQRWLMMALGSSVGVYAEEPVFAVLLDYAVRVAGLRGTKRLFAKVPDGATERQLRQLGWTAYGTETVLVARTLRRRRPALAARPQRPVDTWAIHQLYNAVVPRAVQDAEALTSHRWDLGLAGKQRRGATAAGWVVEDGHDLVAHAGVVSRRGLHAIELMVRPESRSVVPDLLDDVLARLPRTRSFRVYCGVRGYQQELILPLEARGFAPMLDQDLLLRYTTASVRLPVVESTPFRVEVVEKLPQRVPTFLNGRRPDRSAGSG